jgi:hypothetical protein
MMGAYILLAEKTEKILKNNSTVFFLILIIVFAAHGIGVFNNYTWDDIYLIPKAKELASSDGVSSFMKALFTDRHAGSSSKTGAYYRPLRTLIFVLATSLPGKPTLYLHALSIFMHSLVAYMIFLIGRFISGKRLIPFFGALLFSVHPVTTESVAGISNIKEILATLFVLVTIYCTYKIAEENVGRVIYMSVVAVSTFLGLLSKETSLVIPIISVFMVLVYWDQRKVLFPNVILPIFIVTGLYLFLILRLSPGPEKGEYILASPLISLYTTSAAFVKYSEIIVWPAELAVRHDIDWITTPLNWSVISVAIFFFVLTALAVSFLRKKDRRAIPLIFFISTVLPISNIIPLIGHVMSERYIYMPLTAICIIMVSFIKEEKILAGKVIKYVIPAALIVIVAFSVRTAARTMDWKNDRILFESAVKIAPRALAVRWKLFQIYSQAGEHQKAQREYNEMVKINRDVVGKYIYYARKRRLDGDYEKAEKIWDMAEYSASGNPDILNYVKSLRNK